MACSFLSFYSMSGLKKNTGAKLRDMNSVSFIDTLVELGGWAKNAHGAGTTDSLGHATLVLGRQSSLFP